MTAAFTSALPLAHVHLRSILTPHMYAGDAGNGDPPQPVPPSPPRHQDGDYDGAPDGDPDDSDGDSKATRSVLAGRGDTDEDTVDLSWSPEAETGVLHALPSPRQMPHLRFK